MNALTETSPFVGGRLAPLVLPLVFTPAECAAIAALAEEAGPAPAGLVKGRSDRDLRRAKIAWLDDQGSGAWVFNRIVDTVIEANRAQFDFALTEFAESAQVAVYEGNDEGHFDWHSDTGEGRLAGKRKLTFVAQLSAPEDYEGGALELNPNGTIQSLPRDQGAAVLFPSFTLHRVTPVTAGIRRSLTLWVHGPGFR